MMIRTASYALAIALVCGGASAAENQSLPKQIGVCALTTIKAVETRLIDGSNNKPIAGSGSAVRFANGGYQVSYDTVPAVEQSKPGDLVRICLVSIPKDCPKGDTRGREYRTTNMRTYQTWRLPDSEHSCGGA